MMNKRYFRRDCYCVYHLFGSYFVCGYVRGDIVQGRIIGIQGDPDLSFNGKWNYHTWNKATTHLIEITKEQFEQQVYETWEV